MCKSSAIGIDIGTYYIRAAVIFTHHGDIILKSYHEILTLKPLFSSNNLFNYQEIVKKLQELKMVLLNSGQNAAISIPDDAVFNHIIPLDINLKGTEVQFAIEQALASESLISVEDLSIDFAKVDIKNAAKSLTSEFYVCTTHKELITERIETLSKSGFNLVLIEAESQSLIRILYLVERLSVNGDKNSVEKNILIYANESTITMCCRDQTEAFYCKRLSIGLDALSEFDLSHFIQLLSRSICNELLLTSSCFQHVMLWYIGKFGEKTKFEPELKQQLATDIIALLELSVAVEIRSVHMNDVLSCEFKSTEITGYEKAISLALGALEWVEV